MIVLGIAPGLQNLGYCVVSCDANRELPHALYWELLKGIWMRGATAPAELQKKAKAHRLVLDIVLERWQPMLIAVGPPALTKEPKLQVEATRFVLRLLLTELIGAGLPVRYIEWQTKQEIADVLGIAEWRQVLAGRLTTAEHTAAPEDDPEDLPPSPRELKKPALQIAAATALAGLAVLQAEKKSQKTCA